MAHVRSTAYPHEDTTEIGSEGHASRDSSRRMESTPMSDVGCHSGVGADMDEGSCT
jgi:hypothetical protein